MLENVLYADFSLARALELGKYRGNPIVKTERFVVNEEHDRWYGRHYLQSPRIPRRKE